MVKGLDLFSLGVVIAGQAVDTDFHNTSNDWPEPETAGSGR